MSPEGEQEPGTWEGNTLDPKGERKGECGQRALSSRQHCHLPNSHLVRLSLSLLQLALHPGDRARPERFCWAWCQWQFRNVALPPDVSKCVPLLDLVLLWLTIESHTRMPGRPGLGQVRPWTL